MYFFVLALCLWTVWLPILSWQIYWLSKAEDEPEPESHPVEDVTKVD